MRITLVTAPPGEMSTQRVGILLEQAIRQLCTQQPGYNCMVQPGKDLPGRLSFGQRLKQKRAIKQSDADVVVYSSIGNLLLVNGLRIAVAITEPVSGSQKALLQKARFQLAAIITDSQALRDDIAHLFQVPESRIHLIQLVEEDAFTGLPEAHQTREKFTSGHEYFFYGGSIGRSGEWERVLQAFSIFKKWQQSGLQMVLGGNIEAGYENTFLEKFNTYKYRGDVACLHALAIEDKHQLITAAFGVLASGQSFNGRMDIVNAFRAAVPVIADKTPITKELCGEAALYADFKERESLSQQMILLYKNEEHYNTLAQKGRSVGAAFSREQMLLQLNNCLMLVAER